MLVFMRAKARLTPVPDRVVRLRKALLHLGVIVGLREGAECLTAGAEQGTSWNSFNDR